MGKISDALERKKREQTVKVDPLPLKMPERIDPGDIESEQAKRTTVGRRRYNSKLLELSAPGSLDAENFKVLRSHILFPRKGRRLKTIMVTSSQPGEGKTFVAANLAVSLALGIEEQVLLLDCDLRAPNLHTMFGYRRSKGLYEHLMDKKDLSELIIPTEIEKLSFLAAGEAPQRPSELLSSSLMENFFKEVVNRYPDHFLIIDSAPCQVAADAGVLARYVDGILLVVRAGKSPRKEVQKTIENLGTEKLLGVVFNGYNQARKSYYKYYRNYTRRR